jgi:hypothetical protein
MARPESAKTSDRAHGRYDGPFLFCDYWASVLNLRDIVNLEALSQAGMSLELLRKILNRPSAALPRLGYYMLSPVLKPLQVIARGLLSIGRPAETRPRKAYNRDAMRNLLVQHALRVKPGPKGSADVYSGDCIVAEDIVNPLRLRGSVSLFFARYKVFLASLVALGYGALIVPISRLFGGGHTLVAYLGVLFYPIVLVILWILFDDLLTAVVAPLPLIALRMILRVGQGFEGFVIAVVGVALVLYLVEWFFIPRSLPPALYLYVNDGGSQHFPYRAGHEPYWLQGKYYWVWRYVTLAPAELIKFWEKDWERIEIWLRADGKGRGRIEWIVTDWHYRELWFKYETLTRTRAQMVHERILAKHLDSDNLLTWVVEMDMDLVFHSPVVRDIYLAAGRRLGYGRRFLSILNVIIRKRTREDPEKHKRGLEQLEIQGSEFLDDVPEHFRTTVTRRLLSLPWLYWRFPRGVKSSRRVLVYGGASSVLADADLAADRRFQIKEPGRDKSGLSSEPTTGLQLPVD